MFEEFQGCFDDADLLGITSVFSAGEKEIHGIDSSTLVEKIKKRGKLSPTYIDDEKSFEKFLKGSCRKGDIFLCLGAGSITNWVNKLEYLKRK